MTEEIQQEVPKVKNYLLMIDDMSMMFLSKLIPGMKFVEVEGMSMIDNPGYQVLVNPLPKPVEAPVEQQAEEVKVDECCPSE